jgi:Zn-dependent alcohol dehydrogenase
LILVGQPKSNESLELRNAIELFHGSGKMVLATQGGGFDPAEDIPRYEKALTGLEGEISAMITHRLSLMDINLAIELINSSHAGRVVIQLGDS